MTVSQLTDRVLAGESLHGILESAGQSIAYWSNLGRRTDAVVREGAFLSTTATAILTAVTALQHFKVKDQEAKTRSKDLWHALGIKGVSHLDVDISPEIEVWQQAVGSSGAEREKLGKSRIFSQKALVTSLVVSAAAGLLSRYEIFRRLGQYLDRRKIAKTLRADVSNLMADMKPEHKDSVDKVCKILLSADPFTDVAKFKASLSVLNAILSGAGEPSYARHIESINKFTEVLP